MHMASSDECCRSFSYDSGRGQIPFKTLPSGQMGSASFFRKKSFRSTVRVSNRLDPDQARCFAGLGLGLNVLLSLPNVTSRRH